MKTNNKLTISIVDGINSVQFDIHKIAKKIALYALAVLGLMIGVYVIFMYFLLNDMRMLVSQKDEARMKFQEIYELNAQIERSIEYKANELTKMSGKIDEFEALAGINHNVINKADSLDLSSLNTIQKQLLLKILPSGYPVTSKSPISNFSKNVSMLYFSTPIGTPIYARANGIIEVASSTPRYGIYVRIGHSFGFSSIYAGLGKLVVKHGEFVVKDQLIGFTGSSSGKDGLLYELRFLNNPIHTLDYVKLDENNLAILESNQDSINWKTLLWALDDIASLQNIRSSMAEESISSSDKNTSQIPNPSAPKSAQDLQDSEAKI